MWTVPYESDEELDKAVHDLLSEISQEAQMRNCFIAADTWEEGTERRWKGGLKCTFSSVAPQTIPDPGDDY